MRWVLFAFIFSWITSCYSSVQSTSEPLSSEVLIHNQCESYWDARWFPITVYVDANMPPAYVLSAVIAAEQWNLSTGAPVFNPVVTTPQQLGSYPHHSIYVRIGTYPKFDQNLYSGWAVPHYNDYGDGLYGAIDSADIYLKEEDRYYLVPLIMHELGHALGLSHDEEFNSIMNPTVPSDSPVIMEEDKRRVQEMIDGVLPVPYCFP